VENTELKFSLGPGYLLRDGDLEEQIAAEGERS
jgi:hypothetical protein